MTATQLLVILHARRQLIWRVFAGIVFAVLLVSLIWPNSYLSEATVVVNSITTDPVSGIEQPSVLLPGTLATELDVIASRSVALKVVDKLHLTEDPYFKKKFESASTSLFGTKNPVASARDWIADRLIKKNLTVVAPKEGNVIGIDLMAYDPTFSAALANAFAQAYIQTHLEVKMQPARGQATWFNEQLADLRNAVDIAQQRLSDYQRSHSVIGTDNRVDVENARLNEISDQLIVAQNAMYDARTRLNQMNEAIQHNQLQEIPDIEGNTLLQTMKANLAVAEGKLAQISSSFGNNHPDYISAEAQVKELRRKLLAEVEVARGSISQAAAISARKETELRHALEQQRDRVLALKREQDDLDKFKREVADAQTAYDAGMQRATQVRLESRLDQSNIAILSSAVPPMKVARPKLLLNMLLAIVLGAAFGIAAAVAKEMTDPRVRSSADIAASVGLNLLAEIPQRRRSSTGVFGRLFQRKPRILMLSREHPERV